MAGLPEPTALVTQKDELRLMIFARHRDGWQLPPSGHTRNEP